MGKVVLSEFRELTVTVTDLCALSSTLLSTELQNGFKEYSNAMKPSQALITVVVW